MSHLPDSTELLTIQKAAHILGVSIETLRRWDRSGRLPSHRTKGGQRRYTLNQVLAFRRKKRKQEALFVPPPKEVSFQESSSTQPLHGSHPPDKPEYKTFDGAVFTDIVHQKVDQDVSKDKEVDTIAGDIEHEDESDTSSNTEDATFVRKNSFFGPKNSTNINNTYTNTPDDSDTHSRTPGVMIASLGAVVMLLLTGMFVLGERIQLPGATHIAAILTRDSDQSSEIESQVLQAQAASLEKLFAVHIPAVFERATSFQQSVAFESDISVLGTAEFLGSVSIPDGDLSLGTGTLTAGTVNAGAVIADTVTASNVVNTLTAGDGIGITDGQSPTISNTGVLSLQGQAGALSLSAGSGISIDGLTISSTVTGGSSANAFGTIAVSGQTDVTADGESDTLTFVAGTNVALTTSGNTLTIASSGTNSQWTTAGSDIYYTSGNVGIGTTAPQSTFDLRGNLTVQGDPGGSALTVLNYTGTDQNILTASASGTTRFTLGNDGTLTLPSYAGTNAVLYADSQGVIATATTGSSSLCLLSGGSGAPSWGSCAGSGTDSPFASLGGYIVQNVVTEDVLFGGTATSSAKFAVLNLNSGVPVASVSAPASGNAISLSGDGQIQTVRNRNLTIGGNSTGSILFAPNNTTSVIFSGSGNVGIGTTAPTTALDVNGVITATGGTSTQWNTAFSWGDHSAQGYVTTSDDTVSGTELDGVFSTNGILVRTGAGTYSTITDNSSNWDTAFGWGNHALAGYITDLSGFDTDDLAEGTTNLYSQWDPATGGINFAGGNVGIGTTAPTAPLDVVGSASTSGTLTFRGTTDPKINVLNGEAFGIRTSPGGDAGLAERFTILPNGNVGIGTTTPGTLLDVNGVITATGGNSTQWNTAFSWGDHAAEGYLTSYTETDPIFTASDAFAITSTDIGNWDDAFSWGDHALEGYVTTSDDTVSGTELDGVFSTNGILVRTGAGTYSTITDNSSNWDTAFGWGNHALSGYITDLSGFDTDDLTEGATNLYSQWETATGGINFAGGNVGIGTTAPTASLDVNGAASLSGTLTFRNGDASILATQGNNLSIGNDETGNIIFDTSILSSAIPLSLSASALNTPSKAIIDAINEAYAAGSGGVGGVWTLSSEKVFPTTVSNQIGIGTTTTGDITSSLFVTRNLSSGALGKSLAIFDQTENQDIFTASSSGVTRLTIGIDGTLTIPTYAGDNAILYAAENTGQIATTTTSSGGLCLVSGSGGNPSWVSCSGAVGQTSNWTEESGALFPNNITLDLLVGGTSTESANFAFINSDTPTASIAGNLALTGSSSQLNLLNNSTFNIRQSVGGDSGLASRLFINTVGNVGIGTTTPATALDVNGVITATGGNSTQWNTAFSWGDHALEGYVTTSDDTVSGTELDGVFSTNGILVRTGAGTYSTITDNSSNWDTAFGWGNHALSGYITDLSGFDTDDLTEGTTNLYSQWETATGGINFAGGNVGIGTTAPLGLLNIRGDAGGTALVSFNELGTNDIFTASASGTTRFTISNDGTLTATNYGEGVAQFSSAGVISSAALNLAGGSNYVTGILPVGNGGTGQDFAGVAQGALPYFSGTGVMSTLAAGNAGYILQTNGAGQNPSWVDPSNITGAGHFMLTNGAIYPKITSTDFFIGGVSSDSAAFAVVNVNSGTPTASVAGNLALTGSNSQINLLNNSTFNIQQSVGGDSGLASRLFINTVGNVGIGTTAPTTALDVNGVITATGGNSTDWNTAFSWGDHALEGYVTTSDDTVSGTELDGVFSTTGILVRTGAGTYSTITDSSSNWDTAFSWGDHSIEGYLTDLTGFDTDDLTEGTTNLYSQWDNVSGGINFAGGNVGIGTTTPGSALDVVGNVNIAGYATMSASLAVGYSSVPGGVGNAVFSGNVGIGTTSMLASLDIKNTGSVAAVGSEKITLSDDRDFSTDTGNWTGTGWAIDVNNSNNAKKDTPGTTALTLNNAALDAAAVSGNTYRISFTVDPEATSSGTLTPSFGSVSGVAVGQDTSSFNHEIVITATGNGALTFTPTSTWFGRIDNVSISQISTNNIAFRIESVNGTGTPLEVRTGSSGDGNIFFGNNSGLTNTTGSWNTAVGLNALKSNINGAENAAFGTNALANSTWAYYNTAIGSVALYKNIAGEQNVAVGNGAMYENVSGGLNTALGFYALPSHTYGWDNTALGGTALNRLVSGDENTAVGSRGMYWLNSGELNVSLGYRAGQGAASERTNSNYNVFLGAYTGSSVTNNSSGNVFIGYRAGFSETGSDKLYIANSSTTNPLVYGNFAASSLGINTSAGGNAALTVRQVNASGDIFTASSSGTTRFTIANNGNITAGGTISGLTGISSSGNIDFSSLSAGGLVSADITTGRLSIATAGTDYENPLTFTNGLTRVTDTVSLGGTLTGATDIDLDGNNFTFSGSGNIGIGTTTPGTFKLQVAGNIGPETDNTYDLGASSSGRFRDLYLGPDSLHVQCTTGDGCGQNLDYSLGVNTSTNGLEWSANDTPLLALAEGGNLGIGTTAPLARLDIKNSGSIATIGSEKITASDDRTFTTSTGNWTGSGWAIDINNSNTARKDTPGANAITLNNSALDVAAVSGNTYQVQFTVTPEATSSGSIRPSFGSVNGIYTGSGAEGHTETQIIIATGNGALTFTPTSGWYGTIDNISVKQVSTNNIAFRIESADGTGTPIEFRTGSSGDYNTFIGQNAGLVNTVSGNYLTAVGNGALRSNTTGYSNTAFGAGALEGNISGGSNTAVGAWAMQANTTGAQNVAIGELALYSNTTGQENVAVGAYALGANTTGWDNVAVGRAALNDAVNGDLNLALGTAALWDLDGGDYNTAVGNYAGFGLNGTASNNTFLGTYAGYNVADNTSGNVFLGYRAGYNETNSNRLYIANSDTTNPLIYGNFAASSLGINTSAGGNAALTVRQVNASGDIFSASSSGTTRFVINNAGNVGIGTTDPGNNILNLTKSITATSGNHNTLRSDLTIAPTGNSTGARRGYSMDIAVPDSNTFSIGNIDGINIFAYNEGTGSISTITGINSYVANYGDNTVSGIYGGYIAAEAGTGGGSSTVPFMVGLDVDVFSNGSTAVTNQYGLRVDNDINSPATATNRYGIYIDPLGGTASNNDFALYSAASQRSYFAGNIGIGTTSPLHKLHVEGAAVGKSLVSLNETGNQAIFTASSSGTTRFVIANNGNVGIGTTAPSTFNLQVAGHIGPDADNTYDLGASSSGRFRDLYLGPDSLHIQCLQTDGCGQDLDYSLGINTATNSFEIGTNGTAGVTLTEGGNFGIGTTAPSQKLVAMGNAFIGGNSSTVSRYVNSGSRETLVSTGNIFETFDMEVGLDGFPRIVYFDYDDEDLEYIQCLDLECSTTTETTVDASAGAGPSPAIAIDPGDGYARIAYFNWTDGEMLYVQCTSDDCSTKNTAVVDTNVYPYSYWMPSDIEIGTDGFARISYNDNGTAIKYAVCNDDACSSPTVSNIDNDGAQQGVGLSMVLDASDNPTFFYMYDSSVVDEQNTYKLAEYVGGGSGSGCTNTDYTCTVIDTGFGTSFSSYGMSEMELGSDGYPRIVYSYRNPGLNASFLKYVQCDNVTCSSSTINTIYYHDLDDPSLNPSMTLADDDTAHISYIDFYTNTIKYVKCTDESCSTYDYGGSVSVDESNYGYTSIRLSGSTPVIAHTPYGTGGYSDLEVVTVSIENLFGPDGNDLFVAGAVGIGSNLLSGGSISADGTFMIQGRDVLSADLSSSSSAVLNLGNTGAEPFSTINLHASDVIKLHADADVAIGNNDPATDFSYLHLETDDLNVPIFGITTYGDSPNEIPSISFRGAGGTKAAPSASAANDMIGFIGGRGYAETGFSSASKVALIMATSELWSNASQGAYMRFETTGNGSTTRTERMRIAADGNIGIGTTAPSRKLEIQSTSYLSLGLSDTNVAHGLTDYSPTNMWLDIQQGVQGSGGASIYGITDSGTVRPLRLTGVFGSTDPTDSIPGIILDTFKSDGGTGNAALGNLETVLSIQNDSTPLMTVLGSGNIGIGTTNPGSTLHVYNSVTPTLAVSGGNEGILRLRRDDGCVDVANTFGKLQFGPTNGVTAQVSAFGSENASCLVEATDLAFSTATDVGALATRMIIKDSGNVGIGTTSPLGKLNVEGAAVGKALTILNETGDQDIFTASASGETKLILNNDGNLGIGTPAFDILDPEDKIHIYDQNSVRLYVQTASAGYAGARFANANNEYFIGVPSSSSDFIIYDNSQSAERFRLTSAGNIGIGGDETPNELFTVGSTSQFQVNSSGAITAATGVVSSGNIDFASLNAGGLVQADVTTGRLSIATAGTDYENPLTFTNGLTRATDTVSLGGTLTGATDIDLDGNNFTFSGSGNVGIGTTAPETLLNLSSGTIRVGTQASSENEVSMTGGNLVHTYNITDSRFGLFSNGTVELGMPSGYDAGALRLGTSGQYSAISGRGSGTAQLAFFTGNNMTDPRMFITAGGNVGIGTTAPIGKFNVEGDSGGTALVSLNELGTNDIFTASSSGTTRFVINNSGNVGIGTTAPTGLMHVVSTATSLQTSGLGYFDWSPASSATSANDLFTLNVGANGTLGKIFNILDNGSSVFSVSQSGIEANLPVSFNAPGDVAIAYDLQFINPTASYIKSDAPLYLQVGEVFNSSDLTLATYNKGNVIIDSEAFVTNNSATVSGKLVLGTTTAPANIGNLYLTNSATFGKSLAIFNQTENADIFTASASGTTRFVIANNGNVGIGTTAPQGVLHIAEDNVKSELVIGDNIFSTDDSNNRINLGNTDNSSFIRAGQVSTNYLTMGWLYNPTVSSAYGLVSVTGGNSLVLQRDGGNVGIGTTDPSTFKLQVAGHIGPDADNTYDLGASSSGRFRDLYLGPSSLHVQCTTTDGCGQDLDYSLGVNTATNGLELGVNGTAGLTLSEGGGIGIGTTTPEGVLQINAASQTALQITSTGGINVGDAYQGASEGSYEVSTTAYSESTLTGGATSLVLGDDETSSAITLPFTFTYYGQDYTDIYVGSNTVIQFGTSAVMFGNGSSTFPNSVFNSRILGYVGDADPSAGGTIQYEVLGSAPNRVFVLEYDTVPVYGEANTITQQIKLYETTNNIEIHTASATQETGTNVVQGIVSQDGSFYHYLDGRNGTNYTLTNDAVRFSYNGDNYDPGAGGLQVENDAFVSGLLRVNTLKQSSSSGVLAVQSLQDDAILGNNLVSNGDFSNGTTDWTFGTNWSHDAGNSEADHTTGNTATLSQDVSIEEGKVYKVTYTVKNRTTGNVRTTVGGVEINFRFTTNNTTYTNYITAEDTEGIIFTPDTSFNGSIDDVVVQEYSAVTPTLGLLRTDGSLGLEMRTGGINSYNSFIGLNSGQNNILSGANGKYNTSLGADAFKTNTIGSQNVAIGALALENSTSHDDNIAIGYYALNTNYGDENTAIGSWSLYKNYGQNNTALGYSALSENGYGDENTAIGYLTSVHNSSAYGNTSVGAYSMFSNMTGSENVSVGYFALSGEGGSENVALGYSALTSIGRNRNSITAYADAGNGYTTVTSAGHGLSNGDDIAIWNTRLNFVDGMPATYYDSEWYSVTNVTTDTFDINRRFVGEPANKGYWAPFSESSYNLALGYYAGGDLSTGSYNTIIGHEAGDTLTTGMRNIIIGAGVNASSATVSDQLNIGNLIYGNMAASSLGVNTNSIGNAGLVVNQPKGAGDIFSASSSATTRFVISNSGNVGIGTTNPSLGKLQVVGDTYITNGTVGIGTAPTSTATTSISRTSSTNLSGVSDEALNVTYTDSSTGTTTTSTRSTFASNYTKSGSGTHTSWPGNNISAWTNLNAGSMADFNAFSSRIQLGGGTVTGTITDFNADAQYGSSGTVAYRKGFNVSDFNTSGTQSLTTQYGVYINDLTSATNNYGLVSWVSSGSNKFNIYAAGSASNYFAGNVGIGTTAPVLKLHVSDTQSATAAAMIQNLSTGSDADGLAIKLGYTSANTNNHFIDFLDGGGNRRGSIRANGTGVEFQTGGIADFAEYMEKDESEIIPYGSLITIDKVTGKATKAISTTSSLIGVASEAPAFSGGIDLGPEKSIAVGLVGQVATRVSAIEGEIKPGDLISTSMIPGVGVKATKAGVVIGKAIEGYSGVGEGKVQVIVQPGWHDPSLFFMEDGEIAIAQNEEGQYLLETQSMEMFENKAAFSQALIADLTAGRMTASDVDVTENLTFKGKTIDDHIRDILGEEMIASQSAYIDITALEESDASQSAQIAELDVRVSDVEALAFDTASKAAFLESIVMSPLYSASGSGELGLFENGEFASMDVETATISGTLTVLDRALFTDVGVTGVLTAGLLSIDSDEASINTVGQPLKLQSDGFFGVEILAGKVTIDPDGNIETIGTITADTVEANTVKAEKLEIGEVASAADEDASSSAVLNASIGEGIIEVGETEITVETTAVGEDSQIFITPKTILTVPIAVTDQVAGESFTVEIPSTQIQDVRFSWWIVN